MPSLLPSELILATLELLPLPDLLSAYHVNQQWRDLVPHIDSPLRLSLFRLAFQHSAGHINPHPVRLNIRRAFVKRVETKAGCTLPDDFRILLLEWPVRCPPPGYHWPHSLRFFWEGFCSCHYYNYDECFCEQMEVGTRDLAITRRLYDRIRAAPDSFDPHARGQEDARWELFRNPPRLYFPAQTAQTIRFILAHDESAFTGDHWIHLKLKCLRLSPYDIECPHPSASQQGSTVGTTGEFCLVLEGPCRGQIHAWEAGSWYDGYEAENFLEWRYEEMSAEALHRRKYGPPESQVPEEASSGSDTDDT